MRLGLTPQPLDKRWDDVEQVRYILGVGAFALGLVVSVLGQSHQVVIGERQRELVTRHDEAPLS
ncbi:hypothetical protein [Novosphingobium sp. RL4]|uniref:hypothetical protein n=1 Tax=Novosphingobium sp. RL4 TaxID=3109595 RepID=UPI002D791EBE|nr:hypothetical protein [Novosphingobium sp. RL4]WRT91375.1 hypothetical protein U9J33_09035 [Novosphingobium sp. RL4]